MKPERYFKDHQDDIFYVRAATNKHNHKPGFQLHNQQLSTPTHFPNVSMYLMNIPQEEENELDALQSAKELEEEKKKEKERQAKLVGILLSNILFILTVHFYSKNSCQYIVIIIIHGYILG